MRLGGTTWHENVRVLVEGMRNGTEAAVSRQLSAVSIVEGISAQAGERDRHRGAGGAAKPVAAQPGSTVLAVEKIAHRLSTGFIGLGLSPAFDGVHGALGFGVNLFGVAAIRTAVGEAGLTRFQFEFL